MATITHSHSRDSSMARDVNPHMNFPAQPHGRSHSLAPGAILSFQFPPEFSQTESFAFPPRRDSAPIHSFAPLVSTTAATARPKSSSSNATLNAVSSGSVSPKDFNAAAKGKAQSTTYRQGARNIAGGTAPVTLNASATLGPTMGQGIVSSDLLETLPVVMAKKNNIDPVPAPKKTIPAPVGGSHTYPRRGHAHRRSGAISSGDVWTLLSQSAPSLPLSCSGGDSPSKPSETGGSITPPSSVSVGNSPVLSWSAPVSPGFIDPSMALPSPAASDCSTDPMSLAANRRAARVSFIENVEIIPRPISSGTETSSMTTIKGHLGADSLSSTVSFSLPPCAEVPDANTVPIISVPAGRTRGRTRSNSQTMLQPCAALRATTDRPTTTDRPSTAGAILLSSPISPTDEAAFCLPTPKRPVSASPSVNVTPISTSTKLLTSKKMHKKALSEYSPRIGMGPFADNADTIFNTANLDGDVAETTTGKKDKKKKKKKQIKNWAGSILGKGRGLKHSSKRQQRSLQRRSPTPPLPRSDLQAENEWSNAAWSDSYVLMPVDGSPTLNSSSENIATSGIDSPVIDLDAALGPFKTPVGPSAGFAAARRRRMHSAQGNPGFHRRSESMPEMQLFSLEEDEDYHMDDVFEEEEEEEDDGECDSSEDDEEEGKLGSGQGLGIGIKVVDEDLGGDWQDGIEMEWGPEDIGEKKKDVTTKSTGGGIETTPSRGHRKSLSLSGLNTSSLMNSGLSDVETPSPSSRRGPPADLITSARSSSSTVTAIAVVSQLPPLDSPSSYVTACSSPDTPIQPEFLADEYIDSASSFDYADFLGEPGPEMRMSVDDVPSLTSSSSIMTMSAVYAAMPPTPVTGPPEKEVKKEGGVKKRWSKMWSFFLRK